MAEVDFLAGALPEHQIPVAQPERDTSSVSGVRRRRRRLAGSKPPDACLARRFFITQQRLVVDTLRNG